MSSAANPRSRSRKRLIDHIASFRRAGFDHSVHTYPGTLKIKKASRLTPVQRDVEALFAAQIEADLASTPSSIGKIDDALSAGKRVAIIYIHRPVEKAIKGVVQRAVKEGRVIPVDILAHDHFNAQQTIIELEKRYRGHNLVFITVLDNSRDGQPAQEVSVDFIKSNRYDDVAGVRSRIDEVLKDEYESRKGTEDALPEYTYKAFLSEAMD